MTPSDRLLLRLTFAMTLFNFTCMFTFFIWELIQ
jgi:hypothetical protein